jgi:cell division initiation protein
MRLTPLDIRKQEFKRGMRGLDADEVHAFLATVADEYEAVINDNKALRERLLELDDKVQEYRNMEKTLRDTLLTAERVTVEAKENARREAELIVKEAQIEAEKAGRDVRAAAMKLRQEIQTLKQQKEGYLSRLRVLIESHMKFVEAAEKDFGEEERRIEAEQREFESARQAARRADALSGAPEPQKREFREMVDQVIQRQEDALKAEVPPAQPAPRVHDLPAGTAERDQRRAATREAAEPSPVSPTTDRAAEAAPAGGLPSGWSLDRLKRDILSGTARSDEED